MKNFPIGYSLKYGIGENKVARLRCSAVTVGKPSKFGEFIYGFWCICCSTKLSTLHRYFSRSGLFFFYYFRIPRDYFSAELCRFGMSCPILGNFSRPMVVCLWLGQYRMICWCAKLLTEFRNLPSMSCCRFDTHGQNKNRLSMGRCFGNASLHI